MDGARLVVILRSSRAESIGKNLSRRVSASDANASGENGRLTAYVMVAGSLGLGIAVASTSMDAIRVQYRRSTSPMVIRASRPSGPWRENSCEGSQKMMSIRRARWLG